MERRENLFFNFSIDYYRPFLVVLLVLLWFSNITAQQTDFYQTSPVYPGGDLALYEFLSRNLEYPEFEKSNGIEGVIYVTFVVDENGYCNDFTVSHRNGGTDNLASAALAACMKIEKMHPATIVGKPTKCQVTIPVAFTTKPTIYDFSNRAIKADARRIVEINKKAKAQNELGDHGEELNILAEREVIYGKYRSVEALKKKNKVEKLLKYLNRYKRRSNS